MARHRRSSCALSLALVAVGSLVAVRLPAEAASETCIVAAGGDVAGNDWRFGAERTARLIEDVRPRAVLALGDLAYRAGTAEEYASYYDPTWGRFKDITHPTPGNHEYYTAKEGRHGFDATAYFDYFGVAPQYSFDLCGWHIVSLNSETDPAEQVRFLRQDVEQHRGTPLLVFWHKARYSSGRHGSDPDQQTLWQAASDLGVRVVLSGHDHLYERFAELDAGGDPVDKGMRQFTAGGGGHHPTAVRHRREANSQAVVEGIGVLFLDLQPEGYSWDYRSTDGVTRDQGTTPLQP